MWPGFEKFNTKQDNSSQNETIDHISTIAGSLASIGTEHTESPVRPNHILSQNVTTFFFVFFFLFFVYNNRIASLFFVFSLWLDFMQGLDDRVYDTDHTDLNSDFDESELRRELLEDVSKYFN